MPARNTPQSFGWISRAFHWIMALALFAMLGLGTYLTQMQPSLSNLWLYGLHKSIGLCLLALVLLRLIWHRFSPPPPSLNNGIAPWQMRASQLAHILLYLLMVLIPITGWIGSSATGIDVVLFNTITLPTIAPVSETWDSAAFLAHDILTKALMALVTLHVAAALHRHFVHRDDTLKRMFR